MRGLRESESEERNGRKMKDERDGSDGRNEKETKRLEMRLMGYTRDARHTYMFAVVERVRKGLYRAWKNACTWLGRLFSCNPPPVRQEQLDVAALIFFTRTASSAMIQTWFYKSSALSQ